MKAFTGTAKYMEEHWGTGIPAVQTPTDVVQHVLPSLFKITQTWEIFIEQVLTVRFQAAESQQCLRRGTNDHL